MSLNHPAIRKAYPNVVSIDDFGGAFDSDGNQVELDQSKIDAAALITVKEEAYKTALRKRSNAYTTESDPLFFKYQRGEATKEEWEAKIAEIRARYPYPEEG